jgi:hypothetical protein
MFSICSDDFRKLKSDVLAKSIAQDLGDNFEYFATRVTYKNDRRIYFDLTLVKEEERDFVLVSSEYLSFSELIRVKFPGNIWIDKFSSCIQQCLEDNDIGVPCVKVLPSRSIYWINQEGIVNSLKEYLRDELVKRDYRVISENGRLEIILEEDKCPFRFDVTRYERSGICETKISYHFIGREGHHHGTLYYSALPEEEELRITYAEFDVLFNKIDHHVLMCSELLEEFPEDYLTY